ncbi:phosphotransferase family protein [Rhodococcus sp. Q]|uniref:phosphotransferase family protein n=1 Tax=Rhodococcus sp. Q TaxID=2502252 RepID=UPI0010F52600|nr:phosphotransferase family protein [Rhodococcus sp. Q]
MSNAVGLNEEAVAAWIADLGIGALAPLTFQRIGNGQSNLTYRVTDSSGSQWVLRRPPLGHLLASAHDVAREYRIITALQGTGVPVPKALALTEDPSVTDAPLMLMSHVDGVVVDNIGVARKLTPELRRATGLSMPRALARIHGVDLELAGLDDLASRSPFAERQMRRWTGQWEKSKTREVQALDDLTELLARSIPQQTETTLVHGDFHLSNVITSKDDGKVVAVVDWELSTLGDPLADVGALLGYWAQADDAVTGPFVASTVEGFPTRDELAEVYFAETGRDPAALGFWHALSLWKLAIIAEGVLRRTLDDPRNTAESGAPSVKLIDDIVERARETADAAGLR